MSRAARATRRASSWFALALFAQCLAAALPGVADDIVYLSPETPDGARKLSGKIIDYTGRELTIQPPTGKPRKVRPDEIDRIETTHTPEQLAGDELMAAGDYSAALAKYRTALESQREPRPWVHRELLAQTVECQQALGQTDLAGDTFLILLGLDLQTIYFDRIPLAWSGAQPAPALERKAKTWFAKSDNAAAMLMGASHLLTTPGRMGAVGKLKQLAQDRDLRVAWLAEAQLWRTSVQHASPQDVEQWGRAIEAGPAALRGGPYFVLGSALADRAPEAAALAYLKVPILYPHDRPLSAAALLAAGGCLQRKGQNVHAATLYRELAAANAPLAETGEARRRLQTLATETRVP